MKYADLDATMKSLTVDSVVRRYGVTPKAARLFLKEFTEHDVTKIMVAEPMSEEYENYLCQIIWGRDEEFDKMIEEQDYDQRIDRDSQLENHHDMRDHYNGE